LHVPHTTRRTIHSEHLARRNFNLMKRFLSHLVAALVMTAGWTATAHAQGTLYWDTNGAEPGAGTNSPDPGFTDGIWGTDNFWSADANGTAATGAWTPGDHAVFSAGTDAMDAFIDITGTQTAASVTVDDGIVTFGTGTVDTGAGPITVNAGATLALNRIDRIAGTGNVVLNNGGALKQINTGNAGSFLPAGRVLEINGTGIVSYDDSEAANNFVSIYNGVISGVGGTTTNGGTGTLIKRGPDRFGAQGGQANYAFAKLVVEEGLYQIRTPSGGVDTGLGAVPLSLLPDAVTLNGGQIGSNGAITVHANRGITIGPNGGSYNGEAAQSGGGVFTQLSPLSGSGTFTLFGAASSGFRIRNADSATTFTGGVVLTGSVLFLDESLSPASLNGTGGAVTIAAGKTLTVGSGNGTDSYAGNVNGAGGLTKVGTGTQTLSGNASAGYGGDTRVEGGTLSITNPYLADAGDVYLSTGAALNLMFTGNDTIDALFIDGMGQQMGLWGAVGNAGAQFTTPRITGTGLLQVSTGPSGGLPGDFNEDGRVDASDYVVWRKTDGSQDGYDDWRENYGRTAGSGSGSSLNAGAVPEPSAIALVILGISAAAFARRKR
jgi:autotransporter-associated beta strand protein